MKKIYTFLSLAVFVGLLGGISSFETNNEPIPKEKLLRFVEKTDLNGTTRTILEKDYTGDLNDLPRGTVSKMDVRINASTGEISERRLLVLPKE